MTITVRNASIRDSTEKFARIWDGSAQGVTVAHLRGFLEQADKVGLPEDTRVRITDQLSPLGAWHSVEIEASHEESTVHPADLASVDIGTIA